MTRLFQRNDVRGCFWTREKTIDIFLKLRHGIRISWKTSNLEMELHGFYFNKKYFHLYKRKGGYQRKQGLNSFFKVNCEHFHEKLDSLQVYKEKIIYISFTYTKHPK